MDGAVPSTLHQMMKFVWKNEELVIHGEGIHSSRQTPNNDKVSRGTNFYTLELVNATGEDLAPQTPMPAIYKMIDTVMPQNDFEPGFGLGKIPKELLNPFKFLSKGKVWIGVRPHR